MSPVSSAHSQWCFFFGEATVENYKLPLFRKPTSLIERKCLNAEDFFVIVMKKEVGL